MPIPALGVSLAAAVLSQTPLDPMVHTHGPGCDHCAQMKRTLLAEAPLLPRDAADRAADNETDVLHYDLDITITPASQNIAGSNTMTIRAAAASVSDMDIQLSSSFTIGSITIGGSPVSWTRLTSAVVRVTLDRTYTLDEQFDLTVNYAGTASGGGFGSINWSTAGGQPFVYTLSQPYFAYTWWPVKDVIGDKATADLRFTVASNLEVASNGLLISNTNNGDGTRTFHYRTNYQTAPYLFCFGLGDYTCFSSSWAHSEGFTPLEYAVLTVSDSPSVRAAWLKLEDMMPVFDELFGLYPFWQEKCGIYQFGFGGGMEHQTMSGQGTTNESVTAHEAGHMWWGDLVTCETWNHIWVNEGFATYSEALWEEYKTGTPNAVALKNAMAARKPSSLNNSVYVPTTTSVSRIFDSSSTYRKGGWVLHMLRHKIGDAAFFDGLALYRATHEFGTADTEDVRAAFEATSGKDLERFFDQWIYYPGAPQLRHALRPLVINGQNYGEIYLTQTQSASYPTYEIDLDIRVTTAAGGVDIQVPMTEDTQHFLVPFAAPPTSQLMDPNGWLLYTTALSTTFVEGPPKIVEIDPAPASEFAEGDPVSVEVQFHKNVNLTVSDVFLSGQSTGPAPVSVSYDNVAFRATIEPIGTLAPDTYTLTIADTVTETASGKSLDGEHADAALPSGDGVPGGDAVFTFAVAPNPCPGDVNGDGATDAGDFTILAGSFGLSVPAGTQGDLNDDGVVDAADFTILAGDFGCQ